MAAEIIQFPKKTPVLKIAKSVDLYHCWDCRLHNPLLHSIFKPEVCYVERWFLQTKHLLNNEETEHPLIKTLLSHNDSTLDLLIENTEKDLTIQRYFADTAYQDATDINISKLNRWLVKWQGLRQYRLRS
jgi:hypothetical protein